MIGRAIALLAAALTGASLWVALAGPSPRYPAQTAAMMTRLDASGDGRIDAAEYARLGQPGVPLQVFDADDSGGLDAVELERLLLRVDPVWIAAQAR